MTLLRFLSCPFIALLRYLLVGMFPLFFPQGSWGGLPAQLWIDLSRGQPHHAPQWAKQVDAFSPELGALYRLVWMEWQATGKIHPPRIGNSETELTWGWNEEIWKDEIFFLQTFQNQLQKSEIKSSVFSQHPAELLDALLEPFFSTSKNSSSPFQELLKRYATYRFLRKNPLPLLEKKFDSDCDWKALSFLHKINQAKPAEGKKEDPSSNKSYPLPPQCEVDWKTSPHPELWTLFWIYWGDSQLQVGQFKKAHVAYTNASTFWSQTHPPQSPIGITYRQLITQGMVETETPRFYRSASFFLKKNQTHIEPLYASSIRNMICYRLGTLPPKEAAEFLKKEWNEATQWITHTLHQDLSTCSPQDILGLVETLLLHQPSPGEKMELLTWLMISSLQLGQLPKMKHYAQQITAGRSSHPLFVRTRFWKTLFSQAPSLSSRHLEQLITAYQDLKIWNATDALYEKKLRKEFNSSEKLAFEDTQHILHLPISLELPDWPLPLAVSTQFVKTLFTLSSFFEALP